MLPRPDQLALNQRQRSALSAARDRLADADWQDGAGTAGTRSIAVKQNLQLPRQDALAQELGTAILRELGRHAEFVSASLAEKIWPPGFNLYQDGGHYGTHSDAALMRLPEADRTIRSDLSATLFLSDPDTYDGGELSIQNETGSVDIKLPPGHIVFYNSGLLHEVKPVTRGERIACIGWVESMIYDETARNALYSLREMQEVLGEQVDKGSQVYQDYQAAVNAMRRCLIGRL